MTLQLGGHNFDLDKTTLSHNQNQIKFYMVCNTKSKRNRLSNMIGTNSCAACGDPPKSFENSIDSVFYDQDIVLPSGSRNIKYN